MKLRVKIDSVGSESKSDVETGSCLENELKLDIDSDSCSESEVQP